MSYWERNQSLCLCARACLVWPLHSVFSYHTSSCFPAPLAFLLVLRCSGPASASRPLKLCFSRIFTIELVCIYTANYHLLRLLKYSGVTAKQEYRATIYLFPSYRTTSCHFTSSLQLCHLYSERNDSWQSTTWWHCCSRDCVAPGLCCSGEQGE